MLKKNGFTQLTALFLIAWSFVFVVMFTLNFLTSDSDPPEAPEAAERALGAGWVTYTY